METSFMNLKSICTEYKEIARKENENFVSSFVKSHRMLNRGMKESVLRICIQFLSESLRSR